MTINQEALDGMVRHTIEFRDKMQQAVADGTVRAMICGILIEEAPGEFKVSTTIDGSAPLAQELLRALMQHYLQLLSGQLPAIGDTTDGLMENAQ